MLTQGWIKMLPRCVSEEFVIAVYLLGFTGYASVLLQNWNTDMWIK